MVNHAENIPQIMQKAFRIALTGRKGPVHLSIPADILAEEIEVETVKPEQYRPLSILKPKLEIQNIINLLNEAKFPVILAGGEVLSEGATLKLIEAAEILSIPVVTTRNHIDAFPSTHQLGLGPISLGGREISISTVSKADVLLALGVQFDFWSTGLIYDIISEKTKIIHVHPDPLRIGAVYPIELGIVSEVMPFLESLIEGFGNIVKQSRSIDDIKKSKEEWLKKRSEEIDTRATSIKTNYVIHTIREILGEDGIVVMDAGKFCWDVLRHYDSYKPYTFFCSDDFGAVGAGLPISLGVKLAKPDKKVICICGDGGIMMNISELETAVREGINVAVVVLNDFGFGSLRDWQKRFYQKRYIGVDFTNPDFGKLAELFGAFGRQINKPEELKETLKEAIYLEQPAVVDVLIDSQ